MDFSYSPRLAELRESAVELARRIAVHEDECEADNGLSPESRAALRQTALASGLQAMNTPVAWGGAGLMSIQACRGWTDEKWAGGERRLRARGLLDSAGNLTPGGRAARDAVEALTDRFASAPWNALGAQRAHRLYALLQPLGERIIHGLGLPLPVAAKTPGG